MYIPGKVYDLTNYIQQHPGGISTVSKSLGKDGTELFNSVRYKYTDFLQTKNTFIEKNSISKRNFSMNWWIATYH